MSLPIGLCESHFSLFLNPIVNFLHVVPLSYNCTTKSEFPWHVSLIKIVDQQKSGAIKRLFKRLMSSLNKFLEMKTLALICLRIMLCFLWQSMMINLMEVPQFQPAIICQGVAVIEQS